MILIPPFPKSSIAQGFGGNAVTAYAGMGLKGHPGIDYGVPWGTPIQCAVDGICYATMSKDNPNLGAYRAVYTIVDEPDYSYEVSYGHCSDIHVSAPSSVVAGQILANVGNTGDVYSNGKLVTNESKKNGNHAGAHLHFQVRKLRKVRVSDVKDGDHTINNGSGRYETNDGFCYIVPEWNNGYNGCISPMDFFDIEPTPYQKLIKLGNEMMATNPVQAKIVLAVAGFIKAFS